ncbi:MAG: hypothetical protein LBV64_01345 [Mediterranea sp.]|jgi:hypothetical protein|nr:hypothetical protein [Mediterranea sp.]
MKRRPLSKSQMICITLLWAALCYVILTGAKRIDGPVILSIIISAALVFIPIYRSIRKNK